MRKGGEEGRGRGGGGGGKEGKERRGKSSIMFMSCCR